MSTPEKHPAIVDVLAATFETDVMERSREVPVVVDFWAEWCGPCRTLGPVLERLAREYDGKFILAKADVDRLPEAARQFGVRSIPSVFAVKDGQIRDSFVGVISDREIRAFLDRLMPTPAELCLAEAETLEATDPAAAEAKYREAVTLANQDSGPKIRLARFLMTRNRFEESQELLTALQKRGFLEPEAEKLRAELTLKLGGHEVGSLQEARDAVAGTPGDLQAQLRLAEALAAAGEHAEALELALSLVERNRSGVGEEARKLMVALFQVLPNESPLVAEYRRKLSFAL